MQARQQALLFSRKSRRQEKSKINKFNNRSSTSLPSRRLWGIDRQATQEWSMVGRTSGRDLLQGRWPGTLAALRVPNTKTCNSKWLVCISPVVDIICMRCPACLITWTIAWMAEVFSSRFLRWCTPGILSSPNQHNNSIIRCKSKKARFARKIDLECSRCREARQKWRAIRLTTWWTRRSTRITR